MNKLYGVYEKGGAEYRPYIASVIDWPTAYLIAKTMLEHEQKYQSVVIKTEGDKCIYVDRT